MFSIFYSTFGSKKEAQKISRVLVERKLVACTNLLPSMESCYRWKGKVERAKECVLLIKAPSRNFSKIEKVFKDLHPYECFCLLEFKVGKISKDYLIWLKS